MVYLLSSFTNWEYPVSAFVFDIYIPFIIVANIGILYCYKIHKNEGSNKKRRKMTIDDIISKNYKIEVKCDEENNSQKDIDEKRMNVDIIFRFRENKKIGEIK